MTSPPLVDALVVAAGRGTRLKLADDSAPKQYLPLAGLPVLTWTLEALCACPDIHRVQVVIHADDHALYDEARMALSPDAAARLLPAVTGGDTRQASVRLGLEAMSSGRDDVRHVLIHDAARPFLPAEVVTRLVAALRAGDLAVLAALPVHDTLKRAGPDGFATGTVDRSGLWAAQTPQGFGLAEIVSAHRAALAAGETAFTDDTSLAEWAGLKVRLVEGAAETYKITTRADLDRARMDVDRFAATLNRNAPA